MRKGSVVSERQVQRLLKEYSLREESGLLQSALEKRAGSALREIQQSQSWKQQGGEDVSMPSDYFGVPNAIYSAASSPAAGDASGAGGDLARAALPAYSLQENHQNLAQIGAGRRPQDKIVNCSGLIETYGLNRREAKAIAPLLDKHLHAFMRSVDRLVKNKQRVVGKTHLAKA